MYKEPTLGKNVKIAQTAVVLGDVSIGDDSSVWYNCVVRCEETSIRIGSRSNIQDNCVLHVDPWNELSVGDGVTVGHAAILHGCTIGDNSLIGMGAIVMNGANVGKNCIVGAGALVPENAVIPDGSLAVGTPARVIRKLSEEDIAKITLNAEHYVEIAAKYI